MMRLYLASGQRAQALRQYETCRAIIAEELGVPPMEETRRVHEQALCDDTQSATDPVSFTTPATLQQALERLHRATGNFRAAEEELQEAIRLVTGFSQQVALPDRTHRE